MIYNSLGLNGAQVQVVVRYFEQRHWAAQLQNQRPDLVIVNYGTNESVFPAYIDTCYRGELRDVIRRMRAAVPECSVGPPDCEMRVGRARRNAVHAPYPRLTQVIDVQRAVAYEHGCALLGLAHPDGGPGAVQERLNAGLSRPDRVHLTTSDYRMVGDMLLNELMEQYKHFTAVRAD